MQDLVLLVGSSILVTFGVSDVSALFEKSSNSVLYGKSEFVNCQKDCPASALFEKFEIFKFVILCGKSEFLNSQKECPASALFEKSKIFKFVFCAVNLNFSILKKSV